VSLNTQWYDAITGLVASVSGPNFPLSFIGAFCGSKDSGMLALGGRSRMERKEGNEEEEEAIP
jgi:hypothetical protein